MIPAHVTLPDPMPAPSWAPNPAVIYLHGDTVDLPPSEYQWDDLSDLMRFNTAMGAR